MSGERPNAQLWSWRVEAAPAVARVVASPDPVMCPDRDAARAPQVCEYREDMRLCSKAVTDRFPCAVAIAAAIEPGAPEAARVGIASETAIDEEVGNVGLLTLRWPR